MRAQVEVAAVRDPLELRPADREQVLEVARRRSSSARARPPRARGRAGGSRAGRGRGTSAAARRPSTRTTARASAGGTKNSISICSNSRVRKRKLPGRDLVAEALADLRDPERRLDAQRRGDVLEVDEDALRRLRPEVARSSALVHRPDERLEHEVELARLGQVAVGVSPGGFEGLLPHWLCLDVVGAEAQLAGAAVDERVGEAADVAGRDPDLRVEDDRRVEQDDVVALLRHRALPGRTSRSASAARRSGRSRTAEPRPP